MCVCMALLISMTFVFVMIVLVKIVPISVFMVSHEHPCQYSAFVNVCLRKIHCLHNQTLLDNHIPEL